MLSLTRQWILGLVVGLGVFGISMSSFAATVDDTTITSASLSISSNEAGATDVTYTLSITTSAPMADGDQIWLDINPGDCRELNWDDCRPDLSDAEVSGMPGLANMWSGYGNMTMALVDVVDGADEGDYDIVITGVKNPSFVGSLRAYVAASTSDLQSDEKVWYRTHTNAVVIGSPFLTLQVEDENGDGLGMWAEAHNEDWSIQQGFSVDEWGFATISNPGFSSGDTVIVSVHPEQSTGYATTTEEVTYSGSPLSVTIELDKAAKTIEGSLTFVDSGEPVTNAAVFANSPSSWANARPDEDGNYEMHVSGGTYNVCVGDAWEEETGRRLPRDWYAQPGTECVEMSFDKNNDEESITANWELGSTDARVTGVMKNPDGSFPARGGWVSFSNDRLWFGSNVEQNDGTFDVALVGGNTGTVQSTSLRFAAIASTTYRVSYSPHDQDEHTYWDEDTVTVTADDTLDLGEITLKERDVVFTATVTDSDGNPLNDIWVNAWMEEGGSGWSNGQTDENGQAVLYLYPGKWNVMPSTWDTPQYVFTGQGERGDYESGDTDSATFVLSTTTVMVNVSVQDQEGNLLDLNGWADCWSPNGGQMNFGGQVQHGTGSFGAVGGTYNCNFWSQNADYQASGEEFVELTDGEDAALNFVMRTRSASVRVIVKDQDNNKITATNAHVSANSPGMGWTEARVENGEATLRFAPGTYRLSVWFDGQQWGAQQEYIFSWTSGKDVTVKENDSKQRVLMVNKVSGSLTATLVDTEGNPVPYAWVGCGNWKELEGKVAGDFDEGRIIESGAQSGVDGVAVVGLVTNHEYNCWVGAPQDTGLIGPGDKDISLLKEDDVAEDFVFQVSDSTITGTATLVDADGNTIDQDIERMWCNGWAEQGYGSWDDPLGNEYSMSAIEGDWHVWCGTEFINKDGEREFYNSINDARVKVKSGETVEENVVLSASMFDIPDPVSETFDATSQKTIVLPDGAVLDIPAGALATSGNVTVTADPDLGASLTFTDKPFGIPWDFEAFDSDNNLISGDFNSSVNLQVTYDEEKLRQMEVDEANILPKYWDDDTSTWQSVDNGSQDIDANTVTFSLSHFTTVGLTYNSQLDVAAKPNKPRNLSAQGVTDRSVLFTWKKPKKTGASTYRLQVRKYGVKKQKQWMKYQGITKVRRNVGKLDANTRYQFRVRACAAGSCSKWTDWKSFKTAK